MLTADIVFERRSMVDLKRLVEQIATIDPLTVAKRRVFRNRQRGGCSIRDVTQANRSTVNHDSSRWIVSRQNSFAIDAAVVSGSHTLCQHR